MKRKHGSARQDSQAECEAGSRQAAAVEETQRSVRRRYEALTPGAHMHGARDAQAPHPLILTAGDNHRRDRDRETRRLQGAPQITPLHHQLCHAKARPRRRQKKPPSSKDEQDCARGGSVGSGRQAVSYALVSQHNANATRADPWESDRRARRAIARLSTKRADPDREHRKLW